MQNSQQDFPCGWPHSRFKVGHNGLYAWSTWKRGDKSTEHVLVVFTTTTQHDDESEWSLHQLAVFLHKRVDWEQLSEWLFDYKQHTKPCSSTTSSQQWWLDALHDGILLGLPAYWGDIISPVRRCSSSINCCWSLLRRPNCFEDLPRLDLLKWLILSSGVAWALS